MPSLKTFAFVSLAAGLCATLALPRDALAQAAGCAWYADTAIKQQQENEQKRCGFKGPEWNANRQAHLAWCATQSPDSWKAQAQNRQRMLASCRK